MKQEYAQPGYPQRSRNRSPEPRRNPLFIPLIAVRVLAVVMTGLYGATYIDRSLPARAFAEAVQECEIDEATSYISVEDEGTSLIMTSEGTESPGASIFNIVCVLQSLEVPASVMSRFESTRALDGTQSGT